MCVCVHTSHVMCSLHIIIMPMPDDLGGCGDGRGTHREGVVMGGGGGGGVKMSPLTTPISPSSCAVLTYA